MPNEIKSLEYFAASTLAPIFDVFEVYNNVNHPYHDIFIEDFSKVTIEELEYFFENSDFSNLIEDKTNIVECKLHYLIEQFEEEIAKLRKKLLLNNEITPLPFSHFALANIKHDKNWLVNLSDFEMFKGGFLKGNEVFTMLPSTNSTNSCYWLQLELIKLHLKNKIMIRLDPLIHQPSKIFNAIMFKMQVYGKQLAWERIKNLKQDEQIEFLPDWKSSKDIFKTEIIWKPFTDEIHFTCEELPIRKTLEIRGSRYFHAIIDKSTGIIKHCDGAIRFYTDFDFDKRLEKHIKANDVTRIGKRVKIFQIDSNISQSNLINLITTFFVWNQDVFEYFNY